MRTVTTSRTRLAAALTGAVVVGALAGSLAGPPLAGAARSAFSGSTIKKHSIPGNRLKNNTVTGRQVKESTLGTVPKAASLTPLKWTALHPDVGNGWHAGKGSAKPEVALDAQGIVYFRGAVSSDLNDLFMLQSPPLPKRFRPPTPVYVPIALDNGYIGQITIETNGIVTAKKPQGDVPNGLESVYLGNISYTVR